MTVISVIVGSTRQGRFSEKPARWILQHLRKRDGIDAQLLDLRDFPMPFFDQPMPPAMPGRPPYENEVVKKWTAEIARSDGFIFVTPEYNYGPAAVLKNALDWGLSGVEPQGGCFCELWQCRGRAQRPATPPNGDRASTRSNSLVRPHPCRHPLGALSERGCGCGTGGARGSRQGDDRRPAVVDSGAEVGAREHILIGGQTGPVSCANRRQSCEAPNGAQLGTQPPREARALVWRNLAARNAGQNDGQQPPEILDRAQRRQIDPESRRRVDGSEGRRQ
jgi:hypothetical protein